MYWVCIHVLIIFLNPSLTHPFIELSLWTRLCASPVWVLEPILVYQKAT